MKELLRKLYARNYVKYYLKKKTKADSQGRKQTDPQERLMFQLSVCGLSVMFLVLGVVLNKSTRGQKRTTLSLILVANRHGSWKVALITSSSTEREGGRHPGGWGVGVGSANLGLLDDTLFLNVTLIKHSPVIVVGRQH